MPFSVDEQAMMHRDGCDYGECELAIEWRISASISAMVHDDSSHREVSGDRLSGWIRQPHQLPAEVLGLPRDN